MSKSDSENNQKQNNRPTKQVDPFKKNGSSSQSSSIKVNIPETTEKDYLSGGEHTNSVEFKTNRLRDFKSKSNIPSKHTLKNDQEENSVSSDGLTNDQDEVVEKMKLKIQELEAKIEDQKLRSLADLQNSARQNQFDLERAKKSTKKYLLQILLPFLNALFLAFNFVPKTDDEKVLKFVDTLKNSFKKLKQDLSSQNINIIEPQIGDIFDPTIMEAISNESQSEDPRVFQVVSLGMKIDDQVTQPAMVILG